MQWTQDYNPTGSAALSTLVAAIPIIALLGLLGLRGWSAPKAAAAGLIAAIGIALYPYQMPWDAALSAAGLGAAFGLFPIGWIVLNAVFLYALTVEAGQFEIVKRSVASLSADRRMQALLIAFSFGAFLEGAAGFGTPVAISAALLIGAGFPPLYAAGLALIANTAPVAFGALGTPISTLSKVTGLAEMDLSIMAGRQLPLFSLIVPAWMVAIMSGWRGLREVWPAVLVSGGSFAVVQFAVSNYMGPTLVDVLGGVVSLVLLAIFLRFWRPAKVWRFAEEEDVEGAAAGAAPGEAPALAEEPLTARQVASAWTPWVLLSLCVFVWGIPQVRSLLDGGLTPDAITERTRTALRTGTTAEMAWWERPNVLQGVTDIGIPIGPLHLRVLRDRPVVSQPEPEKAIFRFNWLSATGSGIWVAAVLAAAWMRIPPRRFLRIYGETVYRMRWPLFTIAAMLAIAYTTRYSGADVTLGLAFTQTGVLYPFFAAMLGWLGVALTGSDTSSNALFGNLQRVTAEQLGLNPVLICTANSTGGVMGKMVDAQSIVVASAATGQIGGEGAILRFVFWHSVALAALMGLLTLLQAYALSWMVP